MRAGRLQRARDGAAEHRRAGRRAHEIGDPPPLPERHPDADRDTAVRSLEPAPIGKNCQRLLETGRGIAERIAIARRDEADDRRKFRRPSGGSRAAAPLRGPRSPPSPYRQRQRRRSPACRRAARENRSRRRCCRRDRHGRAAATDRRRARSRSRPRPRRVQPRAHSPPAVRDGASTTTRSAGKADNAVSSIAAAVSGHAVRSAALSVREGSARATTARPPCGSPVRRPLPTMRRRPAPRPAPGATRPHAPAAPDSPNPLAEDPSRETGRRRNARRAGELSPGRRSGPAARAIPAAARAACPRRAAAPSVVAEFREQNGSRGEQPFPPGQPLRPIADSGHLRSLAPARPLSMKIAGQDLWPLRA